MSTIQDHLDHWVPALGPHPGDLLHPSLGLCKFFQLNLLKCKPLLPFAEDDWLKLEERANKHRELLEWVKLSP